MGPLCCHMRLSASGLWMWHDLSLRLSGWKSHFLGIIFSGEKKICIGKSIIWKSVFIYRFLEKNPILHEVPWAKTAENPTLQRQVSVRIFYQAPTLLIQVEKRWFCDGREQWSSRQILWGRHTLGEQHQPNPLPACLLHAGEIHHTQVHLGQPSSHLHAFQSRKKSFGLKVVQN